MTYPPMRGVGDLGADEERRIGVPKMGDDPGGGPREMDPFSPPEILVITGSSLMVGGLITVSVYLSLGKIVL